MGRVGLLVHMLNLTVQFYLTTLTMVSSAIKKIMSVNKQIHLGLIYVTFIHAYILRHLLI